MANTDKITTCRKKPTVVHSVIICTFIIDFNLKKLIVFVLLESNYSWKP